MKTKDISGMLETPEFPVEQTALLAYSGNARQRRKAWRKDSRTIHLPVIRYRDKEGNPTCAADFETGDVCKFYRTQRLGCGETCVFAETSPRSKYADNMERRDSPQGPGMGTLIPGKWCPVWSVQ